MHQRHRLRHTVAIQAVRRQGQQWRHPLTILLVKRNLQDASRFAFVASRRVGKAVDRNRARRLLREAVRRHLHEIEAGWDCLFIARAATPAAAFLDVEAAVLQLLERAGILHTAPPGSTG